jgi:hypothetical protein
MADADAHAQAEFDRVFGHMSVNQLRYFLMPDPLSAGLFSTMLTRSHVDLSNPELVTSIFALLQKKVEQDSQKGTSHSNWFSQSDHCLLKCFGSGLLSILYSDCLLCVDWVYSMLGRKAHGYRKLEQSYSTYTRSFPSWSSHSEVYSSKHAKEHSQFGGEEMDRNKKTQWFLRLVTKASFFNSLHQRRPSGMLHLLQIYIPDVPTCKIQVKAKWIGKTRRLSWSSFANISVVRLSYFSNLQHIPLIRFWHCGCQKSSLAHIFNFCSFEEEGQTRNSGWRHITPQTNFS